jgi:hypothetical protein
MSATFTMFSRPSVGSSLSDAITFVEPQASVCSLCWQESSFVLGILLLCSVQFKQREEFNRFELKNKSVLNAILLRSSTFQMENAFLIRYWPV